MELNLRVVEEVVDGRALLGVWLEERVEEGL
jgi:hypothetical protein